MRAQFIKISRRPRLSLCLFIRSLCCRVSQTASEDEGKDSRDERKIIVSIIVNGILLCRRYSIFGSEQGIVEDVGAKPFVAFHEMKQFKKYRKKETL